MAAALSDPAAAAIGRAYDVVPYDAGVQPGLSLGEVRGAAAALGFAPSAGPVLDVLDIGCGAGAQLFDAARQSAGRMVGVDASEHACSQARARGAAFGERWRIQHGDAATLDLAALGRFDVIYVIGTLYIMPAVARARLLAGLAGCLKPGGVVVVTYYTGPVGLVRTQLGRLLYGHNDPAWPVGQQVAVARANLQQIAGIVPAAGVAREIVVATLSAMSGSSDTILFHEALGQVFDTLATAEIEALLAPRGVVFVNYVPPAPVQAGAASRAVAQAADAWDFATGGGYRVALFGRGDAAGGRVEHPGLFWSTVLQSAPANDGVACFVDPASGAGIQTDEWAMQAVIECLIAAPRDWAGLGAAVLVWLSLRGLPAPDADAFDAAAAGLLATLWGARLARPVLREVE